MNSAAAVPDAASPVEPQKVKSVSLLSGVIKVSLLVTLATLCCIPAMYESEHKLPGAALHSPTYAQALIVGIAMGCPLILDHLLEIFWQHQRSVTVVDIWSMAMLPSMIVGNSLILGFCVGTENTALWISLTVALVSVNCGCGLFILHELDSQLWTTELIFSIVIMNFSGSIAYAFNVTWLAIALLLLSTLMFCYAMCRSVWHNREVIKSLVQSSAVLTTPQLTLATFSSAVAFFQVAYVLLVLLAEKPDVPVYAAYLGIIYVSIVIVLPPRLFKLQAGLADKALTGKKIFVECISHEARGPLQVVDMGLELHADDVKELYENIDNWTEEQFASWQETAEMQMHEIIESCNLAQYTLNDMLTYDKIECGLQLEEKTHVNLVHFVKETMQSFVIQAHYNKITLSCELNELARHYGSATVFVDKHKCIQVLRNFLSNALKFTPSKGTIVVRLNILPGKCSSVAEEEAKAAAATAEAEASKERGREKSNNATEGAPRKRTDSMSTTDSTETEVELGEPHHVRIEVQDNGAGISEENLKKLFGRYVQFNAATLQKGGGSGLGLWLSKHIVELHGGCIGATSEGIQGKGSVFFMELPLRPKDIRRNPARPAAVNDPSKANHPLNVKGMLQLRQSNVKQAVALARESGDPSTPRDATPRDATPRDATPRDGDAIKESAKEAASDSCKTAVHPASSASAPQATALPASGASKPEQPKISPPPPAAGSDLEGSTGSGAAVAVSAPAAPPVKFTVLVIDDAPLNRKLLNRCLNSICRNMLQVVEAENGQDGVNKLGALLSASSSAVERDVRVVFIDNNMPVMNGHEAVKIMRSEVGYKGPIVGLTGDTAQEDIDSFLEAGADHCFSKPIQMDQVRVLMDSLVQRE